MKKLFLSILIALSITLIGAAAYAEDNNPAALQDQTALDSQIQQAVSDDTGTTAIDKNDPAYQTLKDKLAELEQLRIEVARLGEQIKAQTAANMELRNDLKQGEKLANKEAIAKLEEQIKDVKSQVSSLLEQRKTLNTELAEAVKNKDKEKAAGLRNEIKAVNEQLDEKKTEAKGIHAQIKALRDSQKNTIDKIKAAGEQIKALHAKMKEDSDAIKALRDQKQKEWDGLHEAVKARNFQDANTHMDNILSLKKQIMDKLNDVLSLKKQVNDILQGLK